MQLITTVSQKGQVVVPKKIRDELGIDILDRLKVEVKYGKIVMSPISKADRVFGLFEAKKIITKSDIKSSFKNAVSAKFKR